MIKRDMLYFSNIDYKFIINNRYTDGLEDGVLVNCQQMLEKLFKYFIKQRDGEYENIHNLKKLCRILDMNVAKKNSELLNDLTTCYYDRRYESEEYIEYTKEEYTGFVDKSLLLRDELLKDNFFVKESTSFL